MKHLTDPSILLLVESVLILAVLCGMLGWTFMKIRNQRHLRTELQRVSHSLYLAEKVGGVGTWILDVEGQAVQWSDQVFEIHGRDPSKGEPKLEDGISYYHPDDQDRIRRLVERAMLGGQSFEFSARLIAEDGAHKSVISRAVSQTDEFGQVTRVYGVFIEQSHVIEIEHFDNDNIAFAA